MHPQGGSGRGRCPCYNRARFGMLTFSAETYVAWAVGLLLGGALLAALSGVRLLARAQRTSSFQPRRAALQQGWRLIFLSVILLFGAGAFYAFGPRAVKVANPPTLTPTASLTPSITPVPSETASLTLPPTFTQAPSDTHTPGPTPTASDTPTPTQSPTPSLPLAFITLPPGPLTVTPPAEAVAADVRFSTRDNCTIQTGADYFDQLPKIIYAHFYYNNWLTGALWSAVWLRDGQIIFAETHLWDGSTGGCGFSDYDNARLWWPEGDYEVQIFLGERWMVSNRFVVVRSTPTSTPTPTRTPRTPTFTFTPTATRTPRPTATP